MTDALYHKDSYVQEFDAVVTDVDSEGNAAALDVTAFYPGGGGQPCDTGELRVGGVVVRVSKVQRKGENIWHTIDGSLPGKGSSVSGVIDWEHRYRLMRIHSALHVLCGVIWRDYGAQVTGGNMEPLKARMDFEFETMRGELVREIEETVNVEIQQGREVRTAILSREEAFKIPDLIRTKINLLPPQIKEVRTVEIVGLDLQADGGTHVANTNEIGRVRVVDYKSKGRINKRIFIELDDA
ncbi:alanyl-tRNA editing protein [candidate division KSB1 bacterium]